MDNLINMKPFFTTCNIVSVYKYNQLLCICITVDTESTNITYLLLISHTSVPLYVTCFLYSLVLEYTSMIPVTVLVINVKPLDSVIIWL